MNTPTLKLRITFNNATEKSYDLSTHSMEHNGETVNIRTREDNPRSIAKWKVKDIAAMYVM